MSVHMTFLPLLSFDWSLMIVTPILSFRHFLPCTLIVSDRVGWVIGRFTDARIVSTSSIPYMLVLSSVMPGTSNGRNELFIFFQRCTSDQCLYEWNYLFIMWLSVVTHCLPCASAFDFSLKDVFCENNSVLKSNSCLSYVVMRRTQSFHFVVQISTYLLGWCYLLEVRVV